MTGDPAPDEFALVDFRTRRRQGVEDTRRHALRDRSDEVKVLGGANLAANPGRDAANQSVSHAVIVKAARDFSRRPFERLR